MLPTALCVGLEAVLTAQLGLGWGLCGWLGQCLYCVSGRTEGGGLSLQSAQLPLTCAHGVVQVQLAPAAVLHPILNLAELVLQLADNIFTVL